MRGITVQQLPGVFDALARHTDKLATYPSDPLWMVGGSTIAAPTDAAALVLRQILTDPINGFVAKKTMPKVARLSNPADVLRGVQALVGETA